MAEYPNYLFPFGLGLSAVAGTAAAQPPLEPSPPEAVTVTGTRLTPEQRAQRASDYVLRTGAAMGQTAVARWSDPVCPRVQGLGSEHARRVEERMRAIALAAAIPVAPEPCATNIVVSFTPDARAVIRQVATRAPRRFAQLDAAERRALLEGSAPIRWWYSTDVRGRHGQRGASAPAPWIGMDLAGGGVSSPPGTEDAATGLPYNSSMISSQAIRTITRASVLIDAAGIEGRSVDAVADYAAFVAFAEVRPRVPTPPESVLGLFEQAGAGTGLTDLDAAFLRGLYRIPLDRTGRRHRGLLIRELVEAQSGS
jgi:hypothetical protein